MRGREFQPRDSEQRERSHPAGDKPKLDTFSRWQENKVLVCDLI